jgi:hypothetical protein
MEEQRNSILGHEFVRKHNDNKVVDILIPGHDRECRVRDIRHWEIVWDVVNHKIRFLLWGNL